MKKVVDLTFDPKSRAVWMYLAITGIYNNIFNCFTLAVTRLSVAPSAVKGSSDNHQTWSLSTQSSAWWKQIFFPALLPFSKALFLSAYLAELCFFFLNIAHLIFLPSFWPFVSHGHIDFLFRDFYVAFCSPTVV